jgi:hypothetical protein
LPDFDNAAGDGCGIAYVRNEAKRLGTSFAAR